MVKQVTFGYTPLVTLLLFFVVVTAQIKYRCPKGCDAGFTSGTTAVPAVYYMPTMDKYGNWTYPSRPEPRISYQCLECWEPYDKSILIKTAQAYNDSIINTIVLSDSVKRWTKGDSTCIGKE